MLTTFESKAASTISMLASHAHELLRHMGKEASLSQGVLTPEELPNALQQLAHFAQDWDQQHPSAASARADEATDDGLPDDMAVPMSTRAQPLMAMLRAAQAMGVFVTWGEHR
jgi:hypothetical protein